MSPCFTSSSPFHCHKLHQAMLKMEKIVNYNSILTSLLLIHKIHRFSHITFLVNYVALLKMYWFHICLKPDESFCICQSACFPTMTQCFSCCRWVFNVSVCRKVRIKSKGSNMLTPRRISQLIGLLTLWSPNVWFLSDQQEWNTLRLKIFCYSPLINYLHQRNRRAEGYGQAFLLLSLFQLSRYWQNT